MKKYMLAAAFAFAVVTASAQNLSEAINYSQNNYFGTARSMALGNAMTALGGDLGSVGINPAGSAVAPYSQFTISPGVSVTSTTSSYSPWADMDYLNANTYGQKKMTMPNMGLVFKFDTFKKSGLKSYTLGLVSNTTSSYLGGSDAWARNDQTSFLGSLAAGAAPYTPQELVDRKNYFNSNIPWNYLIAYQSGMIAETVDADGNYTYLGATEGMDDDNVIKLMGDLNQSSRVLSAGSKQDLVFNFGMNFDDNLFVGVNLGMPMATYKYNEYFREAAVNPADFAIEYVDGTVANFSHANYEYSQTTDLAGIYAKVGVLYIAPGGFRFGAAIQTPTAMTITDRWDVYGATSFTDNAFNTTAQPTDINEYSYDLRLPARFNVGVAYTFWDKGLVSYDFEVADYSTMRYSSSDSGYSGRDYFSVENDVNKNFASTAFQGRLGGELRISPSVAIRAGYTFQTSPYCFRFDQEGYKYDSADYLYYYDDFVSGRYSLGAKEMFKDLTQSVSCGLGYNSDGSFFADFAVRGTKYPVSYFSPYDDYISGDGTYLPQVMSDKKAIDAVLTLGWRF